MVAKCTISNFRGNNYIKTVFDKESMVSVLHFYWGHDREAQQWFFFFPQLEISYEVGIISQWK